MYMVTLYTYEIDHSQTIHYKLTGICAKHNRGFRFMKLQYFVTICTSSKQVIPVATIDVS